MSTEHKPHSGLLDAIEDVRVFLTWVPPDHAKAAADALRSVEEQFETAEKTLRAIAEKQQEALKIIESNGFVFEDIGREAGNWQHLAFTLYTDICEIDVWVRNALGIELGEDASIPASRQDV